MIEKKVWCRLRRLPATMFAVSERVKKYFELQCPSGEFGWINYLSLIAAQRTPSTLPSHSLDCVVSIIFHFFFINYSDEHSMFILGATQWFMFAVSRHLWSSIFRVENWAVDYWVLWYLQIWAGRELTRVNKNEKKVISFFDGLPMLRANHIEKQQTGQIQSPATPSAVANQIILWQDINIKWKITSRIAHSLVWRNLRNLKWQRERWLCRRERVSGRVNETQKLKPDMM